MSNFSFTEDAFAEYIYWQTQDRKTLKKINALLNDINRHPFEGLGKSENPSTLYKKISHRSSSDKRSFVSLCLLLAKSSVAIATHPQQIKIPRGQRLNESFLSFVRTLAPGFHLLFIPIAFRFHQFFTELFLQRDKRRDEAVANQQEQFIDAVFIINMCGCVAFF